MMRREKVVFLVVEHHWILNALVAVEVVGRLQHMLLSDNSGQNCLVWVFRETDHSLVPEPPERMTGIILGVFSLGYMENY